MAVGMLLLIAVAAVLFLIIVGSGIFFVLLQLGVIVKKAAEPVHTDQGGYSLSQGRDVGAETEVQERSTR